MDLGTVVKSYKAFVTLYTAEGRIWDGNVCAASESICTPDGRLPNSRIIGDGFGKRNVIQRGNLRHDAPLVLASREPMRDLQLKYIGTVEWSDGNLRASLPDRIRIEQLG
jgi:hypothetical protein